MKYGNYYLFLSGAQRRVKEFTNNDINHAIKNIPVFKPTGFEDKDITTFLIIVIILRATNSKFLINNFVANYGKQFESHFRTDIKDKDIRQEIFKFFNLQQYDQITFHQGNWIKIKVPDYLKLIINNETKQVLNPKFILKNQQLMGGYVFTEIKDFIYLMRLVVENHLRTKISKMKVYEENETINGHVEYLKEKYQNYEKPTSANNNKEIPQSIQDLIDLAYTEHHLTHPQRMKLGIFLQARNYDMDYIIDIFRQLTDFNEAKTRYQLRSLQKYIRK